MPKCLTKLNSNDKQAQLDDALYFSDFSKQLGQYYLGINRAPTIDSLVLEIQTDILPLFFSGSNYGIEDVLETIEDPENALAIQTAFNKLLQVRRQINFKAQLPSEHYAMKRSFNLVDELVSNFGDKVDEIITPIINDEILQLQEYYSDIKERFSNPEKLKNILNLISHNILTIEEIKNIPDLHRFYGGDENGPYSEFLNKGMKSLRKGFYKIIEQPYYNTTIDPNTFSAKVLYYHPESDRLIKYEANVGPITNVYFVYIPLTGTYKEEKYIPALQKFLNDKRMIDADKNHYYTAKRNFFTTLYQENKIFYIWEAEFHPAFTDEPRPKKVIWSFIDF